MKGKKALILDVAIRFETSGLTLSQAEEGKRTKYQPFVSTIMRLFPGVECVTVRGFPVGARGKWFGPNRKVLKLMGASKTRQLRLAEVISRRVLLFTTDLCKIYRNLATAST